MGKGFSAIDAARLDRAAHDALAAYRPPGFALGVVSGADLVFARGYGLADIESGKPQAPELRQRIGSITKTMVGLCVMALADEGRLTLEDRLIDHVPEVIFHGDGAAITLRHLLTHTSGIGEAPTLEDMAEVNATLWSKSPDKDVLGLFPRGVLLEIAPDSKWSYANLGFALLGEVVARLEGAPIHEVLRRRIFAPLGMSSSDLLDEPHADLTTGYHRAPDDDARELAARSGIELPQEVTVDGVNIRGDYQYIRGGGAAGAAQSTVPDMARYAAALLAQGGGLVRPETFAAMIAPQWAPDPVFETWGLSFSRNLRFGRFVFGHGGGVLGGWNSMLLTVPEDGLALILHANAMFEDFPRLVSRLLAAMLGAAAPSDLTDATPADLLTAAPGVFEAKPGRLTNFRVMGWGRLQIVASGDRLRLYARRGPWKSGVDLSFDGSTGGDVFSLADDTLEPTRLRLLRAPDGAISGLRFGLTEMIRAEQAGGWV